MTYKGFGDFGGFGGFGGPTFKTSFKMGGGFGFNDFTFERAEHIFEEFFKNEGGFGGGFSGFDDDFFNNDGFFGNQNNKSKNK